MLRYVRCNSIPTLMQHNLYTLTAEHCGYIEAGILLFEKLPCTHHTGGRVDEGAIHVEETEEGSC